MEYRIRTAGPADFIVIKKLNQALFEEEAERDDILNLNWPDSQRGKEYYHQAINDKNKLALIAEDAQGQPVGYLIGSGYSKYDYRTAKVGELENMYVIRSRRRQKIGRRLVAEFKKWLKAQQASRMYVSAYFNNVQAMAFYRDCGFKEIEIGLECRVE